VGGWGGEFLWSLRVELRVTMLCVNTPVVTFETISSNDNLTLKFRSRQTFVQTPIGLILFERAWCAVLS
jgi:chorismate-pyruvate lyase